MTIRSLPHRSSARAQRGAGALIVVMVLFFVMSLVAAYSNRNIIFEQKTSANQYRSTQAFEATEAGIEWALAMLNGGNIDDSCKPSAAGTSFRARYLNFAANGAISSRQYPDPATGPNQYYIGCVLTTTGWTCSCPTGTTPSLTAPVTTAPAPAFQVTFIAPSPPGSNPVNGIGWVTLRSQGCTSLQPGCFTTPAAVPGGEAGDMITAVLALKGSVSSIPAAALTAGTSASGTPGAVNIGASAFQIANAEPLVNGITIDAAGAVTQTNMVLNTVPGSPAANSVVSADTSLPATSDFLFASVFGMARGTYQQQPATIILNCPAECTAASLASTAAANPGRILWLLGNANLDSAATIGTAASPVAMVVNGNLTATASPVTINGLVYVVPDALSGTWTTSGSFSINGAAVVEGSMGGSGTPSIAYNLPVLDALRQTSGSFVRVPGGWLDN